MKSQVGFPLLQNNPGKFLAGNISNFFSNWIKITKDVLNNDVKGMGIPFNELPVQAVAPFPFKLSPEERLVLDGEIDKLLHKGVIEVTVHDDSEYIFNVFLRPKHNGEYRLILDLANLNQSVEYNHFKMFSLRTALEMMTRDAWMASVDLKDAFFSIPVAQGQRKYLRFIWKGTLFQFLAMPNGLSCAPRFFTKMLKPAFACLGEQGHKCFPYIDDSVVVAYSEECRASAEALAEQLDQLGFYIHPDKSVLVPTKELTFLGFKLNSETMSVALCESKREKFSKAANELLAKKRMSVREVAGLVGLMVAYTPAIKYAGAHIKHLKVYQMITFRFLLSQAPCKKNVCM